MIKKVLIVEDGEFKKNRLIREINNKTDYCVKSSLKEAIEVAQRENFDFLITDLEFPRDDKTELDKKVDGKNGFQLMLKLADKRVFIPTVVYSTCMLNKREREQLKKKDYPLIAEIFDAKLISNWL